jgi:hypothetical protein
VTFPWPQRVSETEAVRAAKCARLVQSVRQELIDRHHWTLRALYRELESPGKHPLKDAHERLDDAVALADGCGKKEDPLKFLFVTPTRSLHPPRLLDNTLSDPACRSRLLM